MALTDLWRKVVERILSRVDRITHTRDRTRARLRATRRGRPGRIMVTCYGNICRSPYAAACLRQSLDRAGLHDVVVESAGLYGPGRSANEQAAALARTRGIDLGAHQSRLFEESDAARADLVLVMTRRHRTEFMQRFGVPSDRIELLGDFDVDDPPYREIADPYGREPEEFVRVFDQIERAVDGLASGWTGPAAGPPLVRGVKARA